MSVVVDGEIVRLEGDCRVEDAEPLLAALQSEGRHMVELGACTHLHTGVAQILLAFQAEITGNSPDAFIRERIAPALGRARARAGEALD